MVITHNPSINGSPGSTGLSASMNVDQLLYPVGMSTTRYGWSTGPIGGNGNLFQLYNFIDNRVAN